MGVDGTPYPTVTESQRHCILCGLCVRVCEEAIGQAAIGFVGRGVGRIVGPPFLKANPDCIVCGACAAVCPVGTIQIREHEDTGEHEVSPFKARAKLQLCAGCGARMVAEPVAREALARADFDWDEFRRRCRLCPRCRRKETAAGAALLAEKGQT
jgi:ferredoxin